MGYDVAVVRGADYEIVVFAQAGEFAPGNDDDLLHPAGGLFKQATEVAALSLARVRLVQELSLEEKQPEVYRRARRLS
jgi:hypothetical protein